MTHVITFSSLAYLTRITKPNYSPDRNIMRKIHSPMDPMVQCFVRAASREMDAKDI